MIEIVAVIQLDKGEEFSNPLVFVSIGGVPMALNTIICGVTGSESSLKAASEAALLAQRNQARLIYVFAIDLSFLEGMAVELSPRVAEDSLRHLGNNILDHAEKIALSQGVAPKKILREGPVLEVLKQVVQDEKADLLVIGHEKHSFFEKVVFKKDSVEDHIQELKKQTGVEVTVIK